MFDPAVSPLPFVEAIAWARSRQAVLPETYYGQLQGLSRSMAFSVSGLAKMDQIQQVLDSLIHATDSGDSFGAWKQQVASGEIPLDLPAHRLDNIFRTNIQDHYARGRCEQQRRHTDTHPWYLYDATNDDRTRPTHAAMDGFVARHDDPMWEVWTPPCGYRCRCRRIALSEAQAERFRRSDEKRIRESDDANASRASALMNGPDDGWGYSVCEEPTEGMRRAIERRRQRCGSVEMAAGRAPCHEEAGEFLDALEQSLTPHQPEEELRGRLPPALWRRFEQFSRAPGESAGLGLAERVAVTAYTDRDIGRVVNATARAMSPAGGDLPPEYELGAWLILALDNALTALPPSPGAYWRGMSVRAGWSPMPPELAERWEDAHRPGRLVRHNGYTSLMGEEGRQYGGDWQFLVQSLTARDISAFSLPGDQELLLPRGAILRYEGFRMGYRILTEMREGNVKTNRQFDPDSERTREQIIAGMIAGGYTPTEAEAAMSEIDATLERWNARKASGEHSPISAEATRRMGERMADQVWSPVEKE